MIKSRSKHVEVTISWLSILRICLFVGFGYLFINFQQIVLLLILAYLLSATAQLISAEVAQRDSKPIVGIIGFYGAILTVVVVTVGLFIPLVINEAQNLSNTFPAFAGNISRTLNDLGFGVLAAQIFNSSFTDILEFSYQPLVSTITELTSVLTFLFLAVILSLYLTFQGDNIEKWFIKTSILPFINDLKKSIEFKEAVGKWVAGQIILGISMTFLTLVVFTILGIEYGVLFATLLGLAEFIPFMGPPAISIPIAILISTQSPIYAVFFISYYLIIQQLKGFVLTPLAHKQLEKIHPVLVIAIAGVGYLTLGWLGVIISIPFGVGAHHMLIDHYK
jgi:predicted PurR-regulated permease PerM